MSSLLEVALSGNEEQKPFDYKLRPEISVFVDLALGCAKEPARSLWITIQDYAVSKGKLLRTSGAGGGVGILNVYPALSPRSSGQHLWFSSPFGVSSSKVS